MSGPAEETTDVDAHSVPDGHPSVPTDRARGPWSPDPAEAAPRDTVGRNGRAVQSPCIEPGR